MDLSDDDLIALREEHLNFLKTKGQFSIECSREIFNFEQIEILKKYGHWFKALVDGTLESFTKSQRDFVEVIKGNADPVSLEEKVWWLYIKRKEYEDKYSERLKRKYKLDEDPFYHRDDIGKLRGSMMGVVNQSHNSGMQTATFGRYTGKK
jgi:uncharacterized protein YifE (UPF0438 family)